MNRRLNVYITFSRKDRYQTEGLCGTWNNNWDDDFTGRNGIVYDRAYPFARTWRYINKCHLNLLIPNKILNQTID